MITKLKTLPGNESLVSACERPLSKIHSKTDTTPLHLGAAARTRGPVHVSGRPIIHHQNLYSNILDQKKFTISI